MATIVKTKEGTWRTRIRRKGNYASQTFRLKSLANEWAIETERVIDIGGEQVTGKFEMPRLLPIPDRKDPRRKDGNHQKVPPPETCRF